MLFRLFRLSMPIALCSSRPDRAPSGLPDCIAGNVVVDWTQM